MEFEIRKKGKYEGAEKFVTKIKEIQEKTEAVLRKAQEEMKKYANKKRAEVNEYKVGDLVMLSTKDLKYQMIGRRTEKLIERYVGPYKIKKIVLSNAVELELSSIVKIHLVVNVSRIQKYIGQVKGQRKEQPTLVIIEGEEEWKVKKILNKQQIWEKNKYFKRQKGFTAESNTWKERENLENAKEAVKEFEKEYQRDMEEINQQEREEGTFKRGELPGRFIARKLVPTCQHIIMKYLGDPASSPSASLDNLGLLQEIQVKEELNRVPYYIFVIRSPRRK